MCDINYIRELEKKLYSSPPKYTAKILKKLVKAKEEFAGGKYDK